MKNRMDNKNKQTNEQINKQNGHFPMEQVTEEQTNKTHQRQKGEKKWPFLTSINQQAYKKLYNLRKYNEGKLMFQWLIKYNFFYNVKK